MVEIIDILNRLCASSKLERDRSELKLIEEIKNYSDYSVFIDWIDIKLKDDKSLENSLGCLTVFKVLLINSNDLSHDYLRYLSNECIKFQQDNEYRVRMLAGECMGELCRLLGVTLFSEFSNHVKLGILSNVEPHKTIQSDFLHEKINRENVSYESMCWQFLETWLRCFQFIINGLGISIKDVFDQEIIDVILKAIDHTNRFVRESGYELIGTIAEKNGFVKDKKNYIIICEQLGNGLSDNWSQVRMAASIASRQILLSSKPDYIKENEVFKRLLPRICLNRYYTADGVKLYNQETWRMVVGDRGKQLIKENIDETIKFYIEQSDADNHGVREAACSSISEIVTKLNRETVRPYLIRLLDALILCFTDDSWSVRDVACVACGRLVSTFPTETRDCHKDVLMPLFLNNVLDNISTVRDGGAFSVASVINAFILDDPKHLEEILEFIYYNLKNVKNEKEDSSSVERLGINSSMIFSPQRHNETDCFDMKVTDKQIDTRASMSPNIFRGRSKGSPLSRQSELWERADGCILLIGELSLQVKQSHVHMQKLISAFIKALDYRHFTHYVYLLTTSIHVITKLYQGLGKQVFKQYLNEFLRILDIGICSNCSFVVAAAEDTLRFLGEKLGSNILKGRIEMYSTELLEKTSRLFVN